MNKDVHVSREVEAKQAGQTSPATSTDTMLSSPTRMATAHRTKVGAITTSGDAAALHAVPDSIFIQQGIAPSDPLIIKNRRDASIMQVGEAGCVPVTLQSKVMTPMGRHDAAATGQGQNARNAGKRHIAPRLSFSMLSRSWQDLRSALPKPRLWNQIAHLMKWANQHGFEPADMSEDRLAQCMTDLSASGFSRCDALEQSFRRLVFKINGRTAVALPDIAGPRRRETPRMDQLANLLPPLRAEIDAITTLPFSRAIEHKKPTAIVAARNTFLRAIAAAEVDNHSISSLRDLMSDRVLLSITSHPWFGPSDRQNKSRSLFLETLRRYAYDTLKDEPLGDRLDLILNRFPKRSSELNEKGIKSAQLFEDIDTLVRVKVECRRIVTEFANKSVSGVRIDPSQTAVAICVIIETAVMPRSVTSAKFSGPPHPDGSRPTLVSDNPRDMSLETHMTVRTIEMIDTYYAAVIERTGRAPLWLFEHRSSIERKSACSFSVAVGRIGRRLDLELTPSAIRNSVINRLIGSTNLHPKELKEITSTTQTINFITRWGPLIKASQAKSFLMPPEDEETRDDVFSRSNAKTSADW